METPSFFNKNLQFDFEKILSYDKARVSLSHEPMLGWCVEVNDNSYFYSAPEDRDSDAMALTAFLAKISAPIQEQSAQRIPRIWDKKISNDLASLLETHYMVVEAIVLAMQKEESEWPQAIASADGIGGLWELAADIALDFQQINEDRQWDGEFIEEIEAYAARRLESVGN